MKKLCAGVLSLFVIAVIATAVSAAGKDAYDFTGGAMGKVAFPHKAHQDALKDCKICHHKDEAGKETGCTGCHTKDSKVKSKDAFHNSCKKCHAEQNKGPKGCKDCHKK